MADEYQNLLAGYSPEYTGAEPARNKLDGSPSLAEMLLSYGPLGSHAMAQRGPWMREYMPESLANFLAGALHYAPLGFAAARGAALPSPIRTKPNGEWPTQAAIRMGDEIVAGPSHMHALGIAAKKYGDAAVDAALAKHGDMMDGFVTNTGRYVSREEAGRLMDERNMTNHYTADWITGRRKTGNGGLLSEALELYNPSTGREK